jgi:cytochrome c553
MTPLQREGLRFSEISRKKAFDEIFIQYGRSLKPDLIVAQWLHSYQPTPSNDERLTLPTDLWGKGEDYLWYCVAKAEPTLQLRYMRGAGGGRPFTVCHYESVKIRASMAELAANGGAPMTRYANFNDPESRRELVRYFRFMKQHDDVYHANTMAGECVLLHPRSQIHEGRFTDALSAYNAVGGRLLDDHILFDVLPDDIATPDQLARYKRVFTVASMPEMQAETYDGLSRFEAPSTVRVSASHPEKGGTWDIHFVNYNRKEPGEKEMTGFIADENPIAVSDVKADLVSPAGFSISKIEWMTPESPESQELRIEKSGNRVRFTAPEFLVYAVARVHLVSGQTTAQNSAVLPTASTVATLRPAQFAASRTNGNVGQTSSTADCGTCHERTTKWETELRAQVLRRRLRPHRLLARP